MRLHDRVVLITGGGSGLGLDLVTRFLAEGAHVGVLERSQGKADDLSGEFGARLEVVVGDASSWQANVAAVQRMAARFGRLDVVIGNAGLWDFSTPLDALPQGPSMDAAFDEIFGINVRAQLHLAHASRLPLRRSSGAMIFTASSAGLHPGGGGPLYTASKHALVGLVRQLAYELAPDIRVNAVAPGGMRSDLRGPAALGQQDQVITDLPIADVYAEVSPLGFLPVPADYADWYVALASATEARTMTGAVIEADCGERIRGRWASELARRNSSVER